MTSVFENVTAFLRPVARGKADPLQGFPGEQAALLRMLVKMELIPLPEVTRVTGFSPEVGAEVVNVLIKANLLEAVSFDGKHGTFLRLTPHGRDVLSGEATPVP